MSHRVAWILLCALALLPLQAYSECGFGEWPPCVVTELKACQLTDRTASLDDGCIDNSWVVEFVLDPSDNSIGYMQTQDGYTLNLPQGISIDEVFLENSTFPGCYYATERSEYGVRFNSSPGASGGSFTVPAFMDGTEFWDDGSVFFKRFRFVFQGQIILDGPKLVVRATSLTPSNPDHGKKVCFVDFDSQYGPGNKPSNCDEVRYVNADAIDMLSYTSEDGAEYKFEVYRENDRAITVAGLDIVRSGKKGTKSAPDPAYCLSTTQGGSCSQHLTVNASIPKIGEPILIGKRIIGGSSGPLTFFLKLGNPGYEDPADYPSVLTLSYPPEECDDVGYDFVNVDGRILPDVDLQFRRINPAPQQDIADGATVDLSTVVKVYPNEDHNFRFRITNEGDDPFSGTLKVTNTQGAGGYGFRFSSGDEISMNLGANGSARGFDVLMETNHEVGKIYEAKIQALYSSGQQANFFKVKVKTEEPLQVQVIPQTGSTKTLKKNDNYDGHHVTAPNTARVDTIQITNLSQTDVWVGNEDLQSAEGDNYLYVTSPSGMNTTLGPNGGAHFKIWNQPSNCYLWEKANVWFEYSTQGAGNRTFPFTYTTEACIKESVEFVWSKTGPIEPPATLSFYLDEVPNGVRSDQGVLSLNLSPSAHGTSRSVNVSTTGTGFSASPASVAVPDTGAINVTVTYKPSAIGTHSGTLKLKDAESSYIWLLALSGKTCGQQAHDSCSGVCDTGLQECDDGLCYYCCGDGSLNGTCGTQPDGTTSCSDDPADPSWFDADCIACDGTDHKWQSDHHADSPFPPNIQPDPPVCLNDNRCLYSSGLAADLGRVNRTTWICGTETVEDRLQGVWYWCESTRLAAHAEIQNHWCQHLNGSPAWVGSCSGTAHKWRSNTHNQTPFQPGDQPNPANCLTSNRCLYSSGGSAPLGWRNDVWLCDEQLLQGHSQGVWYQCESTRAHAAVEKQGYQCMRFDSAFAWIDDCPGTAHKWQSDYHNQSPYQSSDQPFPQKCLSTSRCLYSNGGSAAFGYVDGGNWACGSQTLSGHSQGVWLKCEATRAAAGVTIGDLRCRQNGGLFEWQLEGPFQ